MGSTLDTREIGALGSTGKRLPSFRTHPKLKIMTSANSKTEYPDTIAIELHRCLPPSTPTNAPVRIRNAPETP